ncbi:MAG: lysophospholipid acyltransferase family protein [Bacteroidota bacterium]
MIDKLVYVVLFGVSLLPLRVLYGLSDALTFLNFHLIGYRKQIVLSNLDCAFPEKSIQEKRRIAKKFYSNFFDTLVESVKLISSDNRLIDHMFVVDPDMLKIFRSTRKNIQIHAMHNFNWEIVNLGAAREFNLPFLGVYQPITNPFFEALFKKIRTRTGTVLIPANDFKNNFLPYQDKQYVIALVADQNPGHPAKAWWANFFGRPAPFVRGPETAAISRDNLVVFANFYKLKRGVYTFEAELFTDDTSTLREGEMTLKYIQYLERIIRLRPDNYLWSHRRWKHPYKPEYAELALEQLND